MEAGQISCCSIGRLQRHISAEKSVQDMSLQFEITPHWSILIYMYSIKSKEVQWVLILYACQRIHAILSLN